MADLPLDDDGDGVDEVVHGFPLILLGCGFFAEGGDFLVVGRDDFGHRVNSDAGKNFLCNGGNGEEQHGFFLGGCVLDFFRGEWNGCWVMVKRILFLSFPYWLLRWDELLADGKNVWGLTSL